MNDSTTDTTNLSWDLDFVYLNKRSGIPKADTSSGGMCTHEYLPLPFFDDFSDSIGYVKKRFWTDNEVYVNNNFTNNPPTIGVATFDALNSNGQLYPQAYNNNVFSADTLTSVRLPMGLYTNDSVYLSFYYEPGGLADYPNPSDSLILEFYNPGSQKWNWVWSVPGDSSTVFKLAMVPIKLPQYLDFGFRFRFRNLASINIPGLDPGRNGNGDFWHIDYVKIDKKRNFLDTVFHDLAFYRPMASPLVNFTSIPQRHFIRPNVFGQEMSGDLTLYVRNNDDISRNATRSYIITDVYAQKSYPFGGQETTPIPAFQTQKFTDYLQDNPILSNNSDSAEFIIKAYLDSTLSSEPHSNDTLIFYQWFRNYYSYDDGTAEYGYGVSGVKSAGTTIAYRFKTYMADTLQAVDMYFNPSLHVTNLDGSIPDSTFYLTVWVDSTSKPGLPGRVVYSQNVDTIPRGWHRYFLDTPIYLPSTYYIGTTQKDNYFLNIGFDVSRNESDKIFYNTDGTPGGWVQSTKKGALMIRPVVGSWKDAHFYSGVNASHITHQQGLKLFPNPARDIINIQMLQSQNDNRVMIYDLTGKLMLNKELTSPNLNIENFPTGLYLVRVISGDGKIYTTKFVKDTNR